jgi:hypothetical protein
MIKKFDDFLNQVDEASLSDNPAIPGPQDEYLKTLEKKALEYYSTFARDQREMGLLVPSLMGLQRGHEADLEKLAEKAIRLLYKDIIEDVILDIKFPKPNEMQMTMADVPDKPPLPEIALEELEDKKIISEIQKRKIQNAITQGEAVNSKKALNLPEVKDRMAQIMGKEKSEEYIKLLNKIADVAHSFYWTIPVEAQKSMWIDNPGGGAGTVQVDWEEKGKSEEDLASKILKDLEKGGDLPEEAEDLFFEMQPKIIARGLDFSMLVHEGVKGVYELIAAASIPEDESVAGVVIMNTDTLADEIEDLRYGPEMAKVIRDFINSFPESDDVDNLKEHVLGRIYALESEDFLEVMRMILSGEEGAKPVVQDMIDDVVRELREYGLSLAGIDLDSDYEPEDLGIDTRSKSDPSNLSQDEIIDLIISAAEAGDFEEAKRLHQYLKESQIIDKTWDLINNRIRHEKLNESSSFENSYMGKPLRISVLDGKTKNKIKDINTKVKGVNYKNQYIIECEGDINIVYDEGTSDLVEGERGEYLIYRVGESDSWIFDLLN